MKKLTIGKRLALGFGFVLALGLSVAAVALFNLFELRQQFSDYENRMLVRERLVLRGQVELGNGIHYFKNTVLRGGDYPARFVTSMDAIDKVVQDYRAVGPLPPDADAALGEIQAGGQKYRAVIARVLELKAGGASVTEVDKAIAGADKPIGAALGKLLAQQTVETQAAREAFDAAVSRAALVLGLLAAGMVVVGALASWMISRSVRRPLAQAVEISQAVAAGRLPEHIEISVEDEAGQLLQSMQRMVDTFKGFVEAQRENAAQHELGMIDHRIDEQRFPGIYGDMARSINVLVQAHIAVKMRVVDVVKHYAVGDLSVDMDRMPGQKAQITTAIDGVKHSLQGMSGQIRTLVEAAASGDFTVRGDADAFQYEFKAMVEGLNRLMDVSDQGLGDVSRMLEALARGDLTQQMRGNYQGTFARLRDDANLTVEHLQTLVTGLQGAARSINSAAREIAAGNVNLSSRTEEQASSLEETASSMEEISSTVKQNADNAQRANTLAKQSCDVVNQGGEAVKRVVVTMADIRESSSTISDIIGVIDSIAFQTNILALNAAVEAARAGEQGRGFAVVANEVRQLAQRSAVAAREIRELIAISVGKVEDGAKLADEAGAVMGEVVTVFSQVAELVTEISGASQEQSQGVEQVSIAIGKMDETTQQNAVLVEEAAAAAESLELQAERLVEAISQFKLPGGSAAPSDTGRAAPQTVVRAPMRRRAG
ncbi:methyl-accepting chemotaxis protein [Zoogloea sp.]|uniref:methyl-accepting chemotaxis protein n=1 Tax=Zoogloea sp. TaxID=49181 RepID=UPI0025CD77FB|nr:methyl-accepting chemotaxis protein [Zoogloea sp.]